VYLTFMFRLSNKTGQGPHGGTLIRQMPNTVLQFFPRLFTIQNLGLNGNGKPRRLANRPQTTSNRVLCNTENELHTYKNCMGYRTGITRSTRIFKRILQCFTREGWSHREPKTCPLPPSFHWQYPEGASMCLRLIQKSLFVHLDLQALKGTSWKLRGNLLLST